jgi:hypothetical protein
MQGARIALWFRCSLSRATENGNNLSVLDSDTVGVDFRFGIRVAVGVGIVTGEAEAVEVDLGFGGRTLSNQENRTKINL